MTNAVVIGGGLAGLQTAWFLHEEGAQVTVLERLEGVGMETSFANGGLLTPSHAAPWNSPGVWKVLLGSIGKEDAPVLLRIGALPLFWRWGIRFLRNSSPARFRATIEANARLANLSMAELKRIRVCLEDDFEHLHNGTMMIYRGQTSFARGAENARFMSKFGVASRSLDRDGVVATEPALAGGAATIAGGVVFPDDESGNAHLYCRALAAQLGRLGIELRIGCEVLGLRVAGRRVQAVQTNAGELEPDIVILAGGVFSPFLVRPLGFDLPVRPVKGYSLTFGVEGWNGAPRVPVVDDDLHVGVTPLGERLRTVGSAEFTGYDKAVTPARIEMLRDVARRLYPDVSPYLEPRPEHQAWAGLRPMTPDCLPIVGASPLDNLFLNTGHGYLGWTTGAGASRLVVDAIMGRPSPIDPTPYRFGRF